MRIILFILLCFVSFPAYCQVNYTTYVGSGATPCTTCSLQQITSGTVSSINFDWGSGYVLDTPYYDQVIVKFTGIITVPGSGIQPITFYNISDDGFILKLNGVVVIDNWVEQGPGFYNSSGSANLMGGSTYQFEVWYYENGGGAVAKLYWDYGGYIDVVSSQYYYPPKKFGDGGSLLPTTSVSAGNQTKITSARQAALNSSSIYIQTQGNNNSITIQQTSTNNVVRGVNYSQYALVSGYGNVVNVTQGTSGYGGNALDFSLTGNNNFVATTQRNINNYIESIVVGSSNEVSFLQTQSNKSILSKIQGSNNVVDVVQYGSANHYLEMMLLSSGNSVKVNQYGDYAKQFSLTINSPYVGVTVNQLNSQQTDSAAMSITCNTGDCSGYSYTRN